MAGYQSLQDLINAQQFLQGQQQYNMGGGAYGAFQEAQKQKAQQQSAQQLQNFLALNQAYGNTMTPPASVQGAANTMFGSPMQQFQGQMGMPSTQPGLMPQVPPWQAQMQGQLSQRQMLQDWLQKQGGMPGVTGQAGQGGMTLSDMTYDPATGGMTYKYSPKSKQDYEQLAKQAQDLGIQVRSDQNEFTMAKNSGFFGKGERMGEALKKLHNSQEQLTMVSLKMKAIQNPNLDQFTAAQILQMSGGDANKARQLAKDLGFQF